MKRKKKFQNISVSNEMLENKTATPIWLDANQKREGKKNHLNTKRNLKYYL